MPINVQEAYRNPTGPEKKILLAHNNQDTKSIEHERILREKGQVMYKGRPS